MKDDGVGGQGVRLGQALEGGAGAGEQAAVDEVEVGELVTAAVQPDDERNGRRGGVVERLGDLQPERLDGVVDR